MNLALNPFDKGRKPETVDEVVAVEDKNFKRHVDYFNKIDFSENERNSRHKVMRDIYRFEALYPAQVYMLSKTLIGHVYREIQAGEFFTWVIQNSYDAGHNDFHLEVGDNHMPWLGRFLNGERERRIELVIDGSVGVYLGNEAENVNFTVNGDVHDRFAMEAQRCNFTFLGNVEFDYACERVDWCVFRVKDKKLYKAINERVAFTDSAVELIE